MDYAVQINGGSPYITSDAGRLNAYLMGVLAGAGKPESEWALQANRLAMKAVHAAVGAPTRETLPDGRELLILTHEAD